MPKAILDTDILSEIIKERNQTVLENAANYLREQPTLSFTSVSLVEVLSGLYVKDAKKQLAKTEAFLSLHEQILPTEADYRLTAKILADLNPRGPADRMERSSDRGLCRWTRLADRNRKHEALSAHR